MNPDLNITIPPLTQKSMKKDRAIAVDRSLLVMPPMWRLFNFLPATCDRSWGWCWVSVTSSWADASERWFFFGERVCVCTFCHDLYRQRIKEIYMYIHLKLKIKDTNGSLVTPYVSFRKELFRQPYWHDYMCFALWPMFRAPVVTTTNLTSAIWILAAKKCNYGFIIDLASFCSEPNLNTSRQHCVLKDRVYHC